MKLIYSILATLGLLILGGACGPDPSKELAYPTPVVRNQTSINPPFYQFHGLVGNAPQTPFDPKYVPKSVAKKPGLTRESAGALIYTVQPSGEIFILVGLEKSSNTWNFMRGSVDIGDSYVKTAAKELHEETGGVYQITEKVLLNESFDVYYKANSQNYACTFFVKLDYVPANVILAKANNHPNYHFREMKDYAWISLVDLISALNSKNSQFNANTIDGKSKLIQMYQYSFNILTQAEGKNILTNLK